MPESDLHRFLRLSQRAITALRVENQGLRATAKRLRKNENRRRARKRKRRLAEE